MNKKIFVNLPVTDLEKSKILYAAIGFTNDPQFSDDTAACMAWSDTIMVMLLTHAKWRDFTSRPIPESSSSEVMLALSLDSKDAVHAMADAAASSGGTADVNPAQDHRFMISRAFTDCDGHIWEAFWMDPAMAGAGDHAVANA